jgi:hypothetical protein
MSPVIHHDVHDSLDLIEHEAFAANTSDTVTRESALFRIVQELRNLRQLVGPVPDTTSELRGMVAATQGRTVEQ